MHRTTFQESVNGNVTETCETDPETRRITCVSASGFVRFTHVSVAAFIVACERRRISGCGGDKRQPEIRLRSQATFTAEPYHILAFPFRKRDGIT